VWWATEFSPVYASAQWAKSLKSDDGERQRQAFPDDGLGGRVQILPSGKHKHERTRCMNTMNKNARQLGRLPDKQGPRPQLRDEGWVDKSVTGTKPARMEIATHEMVNGTWNIQTLWQTGKLELFRKEMETSPMQSKKRYCIIALKQQRTRRKKRREDEQETKNNITVNRNFISDSDKRIVNTNLVQTTY